MDDHERSGMFAGSQPVDAYTTTNNCSQGLDLRSTSRHDETAPITSSPKVVSPAADDRAVSLKTDDSKDTQLLLLPGSGNAARMAPANKTEYVAQWCKDQREFTQSRSVSAKVSSRKPTSNKMSVRDKLINRITHPFTQGDKKRLEAVNGEIHKKPTNGTLTDVQHSDFVQG